MANYPSFIPVEAILMELEEQEGEEFSDIGSCSENEDGILSDDQEDDNYNVIQQNPDLLMDFDQSEPVSTDGDERNFVLGKDGETIWTEASLLKYHGLRTPVRNTVTHLPGAKGDACNIDSELSFFSLFLNAELVDLLVTNTNEEIRQKSLRYESTLYNIRPTNELEMRAFLGLLLLNGVLRNSCLNISDMFSERFGPALFRAVMSKTRFQFLVSALRFDSKDTREERKRNDKFTAFREFWNIFSDNCGKYYTPSEYLTIDESLFSFRGRCSFKTYNPQKPDGYGLKIVSLCDARTSYFCGGIPYIGKGSVAMQSKLLLPTQYVLELTKNIKGTNRNITMNSWFSSYELAEELTKQNLTMVGTLRKNMREIPPSLNSSNGIPIMTSRFLYQPDKMLVAFNQRRNKNVIILSTMHDCGVVNLETGEPEIVEFYNMTKGGVDVFNKLCHLYSTKRATNRWPMRIFYGVLDAAALNSFILFKNRKSSICRHVDFLKSLAFSLTELYMKQRLYNKKLPQLLRSEISKVLGVEAPGGSSTSSATSTRRRCHFCDRKKDRKTTNKCQECNLPICKEHSKTVLYCEQCSTESESVDI